jgi:hypothetical protein
MGASVDVVNACGVMHADGRQVDAQQCIADWSESPDLIWVNERRSQLNHNASAAPKPQQDHNRRDARRPLKTSENFMHSDAVNRTRSNIRCAHKNAP